MDERGEMAYFMQNRLLQSNPLPNLPQLLYGQQAIRSITNPNSNWGQNIRFEPPHYMNVSSASTFNSNGSNSSQVVGLGEQPVRRKRGRPRKYGHGGMGLALSPLPISTQNMGTGALKRGRGRPPGTGRIQQLASNGEWVTSSAGMGFTPHSIRIEAGEDIAAKILSFSQQGPRTVSVLSVNGSVSAATLRKPGSPAATVTHEGEFDILCLSGSLVHTDEGLGGGLNLILSGSNPDCPVIGGVVSGLLRAATPVQIVLGSFIYGSGVKAKNRCQKTDQDSSSHDQELPTRDNQSILVSSMMDGWPIGMKNSHDTFNPQLT